MGGPQANSAPGVYIDERTLVGSIQGAKTSVAAFIGRVASKIDVDTPKEVTNWDDFCKNIIGKEGYYPESYIDHAVKGFFDNGGGSCYLVKVEEPTAPATQPSAGQYEKAINSLQAVEVNLICIPECVNLEWAIYKEVYGKLLEHCATRTDRFAIIDIPDRKKTTSLEATAKDIQIPDDQKDWKDLLSSENGYGAAYYPWIQVNSYKTVKDDKDVEKQMPDGIKGIPPSGHIAGMYAKTDNAKGVYKAPANETISGSVGVCKKLSKEEIGNLNQYGVNSLIELPGRGVVAMGARTIAHIDASSNSAWKYINIRRLLNYIETSIVQGTQFAIFEPNNKKLWAILKRQTTQFLYDSWKDGALLGDTPDKAFQVRIDDVNNTSADRENGRLNIEVKICTTTPAEFITFTIIQKPGASDVKEF